ncbi:MAG: acetate--CoA ligase family protein [Candidatus Rokubacteria bacterium]|nr:acetate--CoA ligase family protein [Candidatus Rokubacteria bacterium]
MSADAVRRVLSPRSVAVIGASENPAKFGGRIMRYLTKHRFAGRIVPINPGRREVLGLPSYPSITDAPGPLDVAILAVPPDVLVASAAACAKAGVGAIVVMTTGFAELGREGAARQDELVRVARESGMRIVGPNCMGVINPRERLTLTSSFVLEVDALLVGEIGFISQSGALMVSTYNRAHDAGIGFSACASLGNQADLEIADFLDYLVEDAGTRVICLYVEGFKDAGRFLRGAEAARRAGKPLLVVKSGRSEAGVRAARSHTASLAGSYAVFEAACRDLGVLVMDDLDGMVRVADALVRWGRARGDGIGLFTPSGGGAAIAVDRMADRGLRLATLAPATRAALGEVMLPPYADNPVDIGGRRDENADGVVARAVEALASDPDVAALLAVWSTTPAYEARTREMGAAALASGKPVMVVVTPGSAADGPRRVLRELGCPYVDHLDEALRVLDRYLATGRSVAAPELPVRPHGCPGPGTVIEGPETGQLTEVEAKRLLGAWGVPVPRERLATTADEAVQAAEAIGYPVALKAVARRLVHKSDVGGVRLGLASGDEVRRAWADVTGALARELGASALDGCLVSEMVRGEAEVIVGATRDPQFGPVVVVGSGGTLVETLRDVQMALAPVSPAHALGLLRALRLWPVLAGVRGRPALDVAAVAGIVSRVSFLAADLADRLTELDVNPVIVRAAGGGAVAVDARATFVASRLEAR